MAVAQPVEHRLENRFKRDIANSDLVGWIDTRLAAAGLGPDHSSRAAVMRDAVLAPLTAISGTGPKVWSMILAELLLGALSGTAKPDATVPHDRQRSSALMEDVRVKVQARKSQRAVIGA